MQDLLSYLSHIRELEELCYIYDRLERKLNAKSHSLGIPKQLPPVRKERITESLWHFASRSYLVLAMFFSLLQIGNLIDSVSSHGSLAAYAAAVGNGLLEGLLISIPVTLTLSIFIFFLLLFRQVRHYKKQTVLLEEQKRSDEQRVKKEKVMQSLLHNQSCLVAQKLKEAKESVADIYELYPIPAAYRGLVPAALLEEYITSGRSADLVGDDGAYALCDADRGREVFLKCLDDAASHLAQIQSSHRILYDSIDRANQTASRLYAACINVSDMLDPACDNLSLVQYTRERSSFCKDTLLLYCPKASK